ncbi:hypothetical protein [Halegenticoccus tardaugens]|nr:hypothetical protein [Halegenticoccus tardaugens]
MAEETSLFDVVIAGVVSLEETSETLAPMTEFETVGSPTITEF